MGRRVLVIVGIIVAVFVFYMVMTIMGTRDAGPIGDSTDKSSAAVGSATAPASAPSASRTKPVDRVGKVSREERMQLAEQIARARAARSSQNAPATSAETPRPSLPEEDVRIVKTTMKDAMKEIVPFLAECYDKGGSALPVEMKVVAKLTLTGDPDIGTIIDADEIADGEGKPLEPAFDLCLRDQLVTLQIPPLSSDGVVKVTYPFLFRADGEAGSAGSRR